jgi:hypothetical protein
VDLPTMPTLKNANLFWSTVQLDPSIMKWRNNVRLVLQDITITLQPNCANCLQILFVLKATLSTQSLNYVIWSLRIAQMDSITITPLKLVWICILLALKLLIWSQKIWSFIAKPTL